MLWPDKKGESLILSEHKNVDKGPQLQLMGQLGNWVICLDSAISLISVCSTIFSSVDKK